MSSSLYCTEGIILRTTPIQDYKLLLTLFTPEHGLIKLLYKEKKEFKSRVHPLAQVEVVFREKNSEIYPCEELAVMQSYLSLRNDLSHLEAACDLLKVLERSQLLGKRAFNLYQLLIYYLDRIPASADPWTLATSFRLKLLKHDGWLTFPLTCTTCGQLLMQTAFAQQAQLFCPLHRPRPSILYLEPELQMMSHLTLCQKFQELGGIKLSPDFRQKVELFFNEQLKI